MTVGDAGLAVLSRNENFMEIDAGSLIPDDGKTHHLQVVRENGGAMVKYYVDGKLVRRELNGKVIDAT